ncbi:anti-sigma factor [Kibdelosporangium aridum]|uniref:Regulator of SigK n=1 Tax=Kibdelosporangium aridum TaxID=2030 RepID=A0A1W2FXK0_KIBAR|nr:anti-sigma factor [Kibdelosporangium aridum]SMD26472.1 Putative zinc-finger [Kibdelosporangium aridum]
MAEHPVPHPDLAGYVLNVLEPGETRAFEAHLAGCGPCHAEIDELRGLPALLTTGAPVDLPADLQARTFARIHASERPSAPLRLVDPQRHNGQLPHAGSRRSSRLTPDRRRRLLTAVAATVLLIAASVVAVLQLQGPVPKDSAAPAGFTLSLIAPDSGPQRGDALIQDTPAGRVVQLRVTDLPPPPPGQRYTCWFVGPGDSLARPNRVAAGSFTTDSRGHAQVTLTGAAAPQRFALLGVTREPDDGNPQYRGPKVLVTKPPG